jgi:hypothetical protein
MTNAGRTLAGVGGLREAVCFCRRAFSIPRA